MYVSAAEAHEWPIYGVQWHPEKVSLYDITAVGACLVFLHKSLSAYELDVTRLILQCAARAQGRLPCNPRKEIEHGVGHFSIARSSAVACARPSGQLPLQNVDLYS